MDETKTEDLPTTFPKLGEPTPFKVVRVAHDEYTTHVQMEYEFVMPCPEHDAHDDVDHTQIIQLGVLLQPEAFIVPGDTLTITVAAPE